MLFFLIFRVVDFVIISFATKIIPYLGGFAYIEVVRDSNLPKLISSLANFDGVYYVRIATQGYSQFEQAFFPLYPLLIKILSPVFTNNRLLTGLIISNLSFLLGLFVFVKYLHETQSTKHKADKTGVEMEGLPAARSSIVSIFERALTGGKSRQDPSVWIVLFLLVFPTSFFFGAVYTEGLFFLLVISSLYFVKKERYILAGIFAFLASLTRLLGVFLIIPFLFTLWPKRSRVLKSYGPKVLLLLFPLLGLLTYSLYLFKTTGDPFFFLTAQPAFGANRSTHLIFLPQVYFRYFKIFLTAQPNFQYFISAFEFVIFNLVFIVLVFDLLRNLKIGLGFKFRISNFDRLGLNLFSLINLVLPTLTGTFLSIPRFALLSLSFFIFLGQIKNLYLKIFLAIIFFIFHIVTLGFFAQGYFVS